MDDIHRMPSELGGLGNPTTPEGRRGPPALHLVDRGEEL
jgi:hypothetical protein